MKDDVNENSAFDVYNVASTKSNTDILNNNDVIYIRKFMMLRLLRIIPELENKILNGRIKDKDAEKIRIEYFKQYINLCNCINSFIKDYEYKFDTNLLKNYLDVDVVDNFDIVGNSDEISV